MIFLVGGWFVDMYIGRYNIIFGSLLLYIIGVLLMLFVLKYDIFFNNIVRLFFFVVVFILIVLGIGGIKVNVFFFGVD